MLLQFLLPEQTIVIEYTLVQILRFLLLHRDDLPLIAFLDLVEDLVRGQVRLHLIEMLELRR